MKDYNLFMEINVLQSSENRRVPLKRLQHLHNALRNNVHRRRRHRSLGAPTRVHRTVKALPNRSRLSKNLVRRNRIQRIALIVIAAVGPHHPYPTGRYHHDNEHHHPNDLHNNDPHQIHPHHLHRIIIV